MSLTEILASLVGIAILAILGRWGIRTALQTGEKYGREQNKAHYEELLLLEKDASERRILEIQVQQNEALREAREESVHFRATIERENAERDEERPPGLQRRPEEAAEEAAHSRRRDHRGERGLVAHAGEMHDPQQEREEEDHEAGERARGGNR